MYNPSVRGKRRCTKRDGSCLAPWEVSVVQCDDDDDDDDDNMKDLVNPQEESLRGWSILPYGCTTHRLDSLRCSHSRPSHPEAKQDFLSQSACFLVIM
jgi:hypothetical protein